MTSIQFSHCTIPNPETFANLNHYRSITNLTLNQPVEHSNIESEDQAKHPHFVSSAPHFIAGKPETMKNGPQFAV